VQLAAFAEHGLTTGASQRRSAAWAIRGTWTINIDQWHRGVHVARVAVPLKSCKCSSHAHIPAGAPGRRCGYTWGRAAATADLPPRCRPVLWHLDRGESRCCVACAGRHDAGNLPEHGHPLHSAAYFSPGAAAHGCCNGALHRHFRPARLRCTAAGRWRRASSRGPRSLHDPAPAAPLPPASPSAAAGCQAKQAGLPLTPCA
jgi:hypothetical protein